MGGMKNRLRTLGLVVVITTLFLVGFVHNGFAATASFYLSPATNNLVTNDTFNVAIRLNATSQPVDSVMVHMTYPASQLQMVGSISYSGSAFEIGAMESASSGSISFTRGTTTPKNSDVLVATVAFKIIASSAAAVNFESDTYAVSAGNNVTGTNTGGTYTASDPAPPSGSESSSGTSASSPSPPTTSQNTTPSSTGSSTTAASKKSTSSPSGSNLPYVAPPSPQSSTNSNSGTTTETQNESKASKPAHNKTVQIIKIAGVSVFIGALLVVSWFFPPGQPLTKRLLKRRSHGFTGPGSAASATEVGPKSENYPVGIDATSNQAGLQLSNLEARLKNIPSNNPTPGQVITPKTPITNNGG